MPWASSSSSDSRARSCCDYAPFERKAARAVAGSITRNATPRRADDRSRSQRRRSSPILRARYHAVQNSRPAEGSRPPRRAATCSPVKRDVNQGNSRFAALSQLRARNEEGPPATPQWSRALSVRDHHRHFAAASDDSPTTGLLVHSNAGEVAGGRVSLRRWLTQRSTPLEWMRPFISARHAREISACARGTQLLRLM